MTVQDVQIFCINLGVEVEFQADDQMRRYNSGGGVTRGAGAFLQGGTAPGTDVDDQVVLDGAESFTVYFDGVTHVDVDKPDFDRIIESAPAHLDVLIQKLRRK